MRKVFNTAIYCFLIMFLPSGIVAYLSENEHMMSFAIGMAVGVFIYKMIKETVI